MTIIQNEKEIKETVEQNSDKIVLVDFYADWCGPCKTMNPILESLDENNFIILKVNVDNFSDLANQFGIRGIPTVLCYKNKTIIKTFIGVTPKEEFNKLI